MVVGSVARGLRAGGFASVCVMLAASGHVRMSGTPVPGWMLVLAVAVLTVGAWCVGARERGPALVIGAAVGAQALLHTVFSLGQATAVPAQAGGGTAAQRWAALLLCGEGPGRLPSHGQAVRALQDAGLGRLRTDDGAMGAADGAGAAGAAMQHGGAMAHGDGDMRGMLAAHLLVALVSGVWLYCGERAAFRLLRTLAVRLCAPLRLLVHRPVHAAPSAPPVRPVAAPPLRRLLLLHSLVSRGPPVTAGSR